MTEPPNTEALTPEQLDTLTRKIPERLAEDSQPDVEALLATVREALEEAHRFARIIAELKLTTRPFGEAWLAKYGEYRAALDAIASERRLVGTALREQTERAEAAEAELERAKREADIYYQETQRMIQLRDLELERVAHAWTVIRGSEWQSDAAIGEAQKTLDAFAKAQR